MMAWTDEQIEKLKCLWDEGLSTAVIGRALNVSKNAVVGKSHRLGLKPRPSPIAGKKEAAAAAPKKKAAAPKQEPQRVNDIVDLGPNMCRWPFGDPGDADFHFCGKPSTLGKPYCADHCSVAYVSKTSSRDRSSSSSFASRPS